MPPIANGTIICRADMLIKVPEHILSIEPYKPGKPIEELAREYGIEQAIKLASNENPLGPSPRAVQAIVAAVSHLHRYPDGRGYDLTRKLSDLLGFPPDHIVLGNGSDDLIGMLTRALLEPGDEVLIPTPSFLMYEIDVRSAGAIPVHVPLRDLSICADDLLEKMTPRTRMVFICNPNNPTGTVMFRKVLSRFLEQLHPEIVVVVDEAYMEFVRDPDCASGMEFIREDRPVVALRTFSKAYGLAGLRIGYGVMAPELAGILHRIRQPFNASLLAQVGALAALDDDPFLKRTVRIVHEGLDYLFAELDRSGIRYFPTQANFFLIDTGRNADNVFDDMLRKGVIVRSMTSYGYPQYIRVNIGLPEENERLMLALKQVLT
jgi:histidinol-phosphate aminotransferase